MLMIMSKAVFLLLFVSSTFVLSQEKQWVSNDTRDFEDAQLETQVQFSKKNIQKKFSYKQLGSGIPTGIWGYWDFQSYGAPTNYIKINPNSSNHIHSIMTIKYDSGDGITSPSRRMSYSYSSDGGNSWSAVLADSQTFLPSDVRSNFGSLQIAPSSGIPHIVTQARLSGQTATQTVVYVDETEGARNFTELVSPMLGTSNDQPIWPNSTFTSSGFLSIVGGRVNANKLHTTRMAPNQTFDNWSSEFAVGDDRSAHIVGGSGGKVALITYSRAFDGLYFYESTDEGSTWGTQQLIYHTGIIGQDTFATQWTGFDAMYVNNDLFVVFGIGQAVFDSLGSLKGIAINSKARIVLWKKSTNAISTVIQKNNAPGNMLDSLSSSTKAQFNHSFALNFPVMGKTANGTLIMACDYFQQGVTDNDGWNYSDILVCASSDNGTTWTAVINATNTPTLDERYVGMSSWNPNGWAYLQFQEDVIPGTSFSGDNRPVSRSYQKFLKFSLSLLSTSEQYQKPKRFSISQNYPNPFNPTTTISFSLPDEANVVLKVYTILGKEIATLVNERRSQGEHSVVFHASKFSSGVYFYRLQAGKYSEMKKMVFIK
ncbi:MAG: T9SS type A sorting domain-containing protein [Ignavibacteria bacterium]|nr:T9SS type A sorting domain-containing protein [Ignavibacteria bacterium]